jgi:hypothetical protein
MPKPSAPVGAGEEAALKLLEGADPNALSPSDLLAGIEALGSVKSTEAADALAKLDHPKHVAKAARRALFRLQSAGIRPTASATPTEAAVPVERTPAKMTLVEGQVSSYDPRGTRAVAILAEKPFTGLVTLFAIASDTDGLMDAELTSTTKKAFYARLENFSKQYGFIEFVPVPPEYANQVVHKCAQRNETSTQALPQDFSMWKSFGADAPDPELPAPIFQDLDAEDVRKRIPLDDTRELAHTEFEAWIYDADQLKEHSARMEAATGGPLVLSADATKERVGHVIDEAADTIFKDEELARAKERLQETAHFLFAQGKREEAEHCLRAALSVGEVPPREHPFLRELVVKSMDLLAHPEGEHEHQHEPHEHATRTESGIVLPA